MRLLRNFRQEILKVVKEGTPDLKCGDIIMTLSEQLSIAYIKGVLGKFIYEKMCNYEGDFEEEYCVGLLDYTFNFLCLGGIESLTRDEINMPDLSSIRKSISDMSEDEIREEILAIRQRRRMSNKPKVKTKVKVKKKEKPMTPEMAKLLLEALGGKI